MEKITLSDTKATLSGLTSVNRHTSIDKKSCESVATDLGDPNEVSKNVAKDPNTKHTSPIYGYPDYTSGASGPKEPIGVKASTYKSDGDRSLDENKSSRLREHLGK